MPIPSTRDFEDILSRIRLTSDAQSNNGEESVRLPSLLARDETGACAQNLPLWLHYPTDTTIPFQRLVERIGKELSSKHHSGSGGFVFYALALSALLPGSQISAVDKINLVVSQTCDADVNLYLVLRAKFPNFYQYEIPPFRLGHLRTLRLQQQCERAGSDYYKRYQVELANAWSVERQHKTVTVLDVSGMRGIIFPQSLSILQSRNDWKHRAWDVVVNAYFSLQCRSQFEDFWVELVAVQDPLLTLGAPFFDPRPLRSLLETTQVAVFLNMGGPRNGFVAPTGLGFPTLDLVNAHVRVPQVLGELKEEYNFQGFGDTALDGSLRLFVHFSARARRHEMEGNANEALLHYVIALELIFGERQQIQRSVSERVGLVTFTKATRSFEVQRKRIDEIYDLRSRYVHAGKPIDDQKAFDELHEMCGACFRSLLRLRAAKAETSENNETALSSWLADLDFLAKGLIAGKTFGLEDFRGAYISHA